MAQKRWWDMNYSEQYEELRRKETNEILRIALPIMGLIFGGAILLAWLVK